jgi:DNA polymerase III epsilon subunit-like protein
MDISNVQTLFLDTETTRLHPPKDKLVEVAVINEAEGVLLDTRINPFNDPSRYNCINFCLSDMVHI